MKNFILGIIVAGVIFGVGVGGYYYGRQQANKPVQPTPTGTETETLVGNDRDEHGCIGSAGYTWCASKNKCLRIWEEECTASQTEDITNAIKQALIQKNNWNSTIDLVITVSKNDGTYASGGVREKSSEVGGGYFFAAKVNGVWKIVADGNGVISCSDLVPYPNYPVSMIPECYDEKTGNNLKR